MGEKELAINGGAPLRTDKMPPRRLIGEEERAAAIRVFDDAIASGNAFGYGGPHEAKYEAEFADFLGGGFAKGVNSGTNALYCALAALDIEPFSEVVIPPITDPGGAMPVPLLGLVPVQADADPRTYNTSAEEIEKVLTERTRAVVVAHIGGDPVDMDPVVDLCRKRGLYLIEDCAQSHGARYRGTLAGTFGHISAFSTMSGKHHCTGAQGGVVFTRDEALYTRVRQSADRGKPHGIADRTGNVRAALNLNSNDLSAAIGSVQLRRLPGIIAARRRVGEGVREGLAAHCKAVSVGWLHPAAESVYWFVKVRLDVEKLRVDKETFVKAVAAEGLPIGAAYRHIPGEAPWFRERKIFGSCGFPWTDPQYAGSREPVARMQNAIAVTDAHMHLGVHEGYGTREIEDIVAIFEKVEKAYLKDA